MEKQSPPATDRTTLEKLRDESTELRYDSVELHERLIVFENDLDYEGVDDLPEIEIIDDVTIAIEGAYISLSESKRFALNAMMMSQGYGLTTTDICDYGYKGRHHSLDEGVIELLAAITAASERTIIEMERGSFGRSKKMYTLLPEVQIIDRRTEESMSLRERLGREGLQYDDIGEPQLKDNGGIAFTRPRQRLQATTEMVRQFKEEARVDDMLAELLPAQSSNPRPGRAILDLPYIDQLTKDDEMTLLAQKERALVAFLSTDGNYSEDARRCIVDGVKASYVLFAHNMGTVDVYARRLSSSKADAMFHDLYQCGAEALLQEVFTMPFDCTDEALYFGGVAAMRIKQTLSGFWQRSLLSASHGMNNLAEIRNIRQSYVQLQEEGIASPTHEQISKASGVEVRRISDLMVLAQPAVSLANENVYDEGGNLISVGEIEPDFVSAELDRMEREDAIDALFSGRELDDNEKIILSLYHQVFHPSLCGARVKLRGRETSFTYPYTQEDFLALVGGGLTLKKTLGDAIGVSDAFAFTTHKRALTNARRVLCNNPAFDDYGRSKEADLDEEARRATIARALEISPDAALTETIMQSLHQQGVFPSRREILRLFGSTSEFRIACGFSPDHRSPTAAMTDDDIVALAQELCPERPLTRPEIIELSKQKKFVSYTLIHRRFKSLKAFWSACGFKVE